MSDINTVVAVIGCIVMVVIQLVTIVAAFVTIKNNQAAINDRMKNIEEEQLRMRQRLHDINDNLNKVPLQVIHLLGELDKVKL